ncbi:hypothetical protein FJ420_17060 [Mesorhizobium sp. B3-1-3]|uniref:hypothetical protein n=1 Tax=unclassified Mesorhizobium TaxID=325217 RepID=UPI00112CF14E|nr:MULTISPECIES: hypothetical protein [unclassified Mesorhizobium]TPI64277.1 hypothetical protein FJ424_18100 [Mesorhizobium sp. B3-1-8]TPI70243.1 hypothetical protein FJ420_17060 [Mesorhizobium sp. B3-1-3]
MTAASVSRRQRRRGRNSGGLELSDRPAVFCDLRPATVADLRPGEAMVPGMQWLLARGANEQGLPGDMFFEIPLKLPPEKRANTGPNVRAVIETLRESAEFRRMMDRYHWFTPKAGEPGYSNMHAPAG